LKRALIESIEDLYMLSLSDVFLGTGTSYFSTLVAMLIWARTGGFDGANVVHFIEEGIGLEEGSIGNAFLNLHHELNDEKSSGGKTPVPEGDSNIQYYMERRSWTEATEEFISGIMYV
jgi:hypothetical protein